MTTTADELREQVRRRYAAAAIAGGGGCGCGPDDSCCGNACCEGDQGSFGSVLSVDKPAVLAELGRVVKPGGRLGIADAVAGDRLSLAERAEHGSSVGCIAGALSKGEYEQGLLAAGFENVSVSFTNEVADGMDAATVRAVPAAGS